MEAKSSRNSSSENRSIPRENLNIHGFEVAELGKNQVRRTKNSTMFPKRVYTQNEVLKAKDLIDEGFKHRLRVVGSQTFKAKVKEALRLVKVAGYYDFLRMYIRTILEINGLSQLREAEAALWANIYAVEDPVDGACFFVQKTWQMKKYIEEAGYHSHQTETLGEQERSRFLKELLEKTKDVKVKEACVKRMLIQKDSVFL
jgi:hypothetical protein